MIFRPITQVSSALLVRIPLFPDLERLFNGCPSQRNSPQSDGLNLDNLLEP